MSKVNQTTRIMTEQEFNTSPLKNMMSYQDYFSKALKLGSAFTISRAISLKNAEDTHDKIEDSVNGYYVEKEVKKDEAEEKYYAALAQYEAMKSAQSTALKDLQYATSIYGEGTSRYSDALKKYNLSSKSLFGADVNLGIARDQFNFANTSAFKAYLSTQLT